MALETYSKFFYGIKVNPSFVSIAYQEMTGPIRTAVVTAKGYSLTSFIKEIERAFNATGGQTYTVTVDRNTRKMTISAPGNFSILIATGPFAGSEIYSIMGFDYADKTGANSYQSDNGIGSEYRPQFYLLDYVPTSNNKDVIDGSINETGSGDVEILQYGIRRLMKCNIDFINNYPTEPDSWIRHNPEGVENCIAFMESIVDKIPVEFMPDENNNDDFEILLLESTPTNRNGMGYELREKIGDAIGYFATGILTFRKLS